MSNGNQSNWFVELFKYPIAIFSAVLAVLLAKSCGVNITKVGTEGVEMTQEQKGDIAHIASTAKEALAAAKALEAREGAPKAGKGAPQISEVKLRGDVFDASQTVSDQTARVTVASSGTRGYIWIGNYSEKTGWSRGKLSALNSSTPISQAPNTLTRGAEFKVLGNMVVRDAMPEDTEQYFRDKKSLGVIPKDTKVRIASLPKPIDREFAVQWWAEVELP